MDRPYIAPFVRAFNDLSPDTVRRLSELMEAAPDLGDPTDDPELFEATSFELR